MQEEVLKRANVYDKWRSVLGELTEAFDALEKDLIIDMIMHLISAGIDYGTVTSGLVSSLAEGKITADELNKATYYMADSISKITGRIARRIGEKIGLGAC